MRKHSEIRKDGETTLRSAAGQQFQLTVTGTAEAEWQGSVCFEGQEFAFKSVMELLRIISGRLGAPPAQEASSNDEKQTSNCNHKIKGEYR